LPTLFVVATPIGNLEDIAMRAVRVLREVQLIAAEDTRTTRVLLRKYGINTRIVSYNEHNMRRRTPQLLGALETGDVALVSEAGTPGVSDPGRELIGAAIAAGFPVVPVPGPSAVIAALSASGLEMRQFTFLGFMPRRPAERRRALAQLVGEPRTLVLFEAPHRLRALLSDILSILGDRGIAVCRELTKAFEEVFRGSVSEALAHFAQPRGEFTLVIEGGTAQDLPVTDEAITSELRLQLQAGASPRDAASQVAVDMGVPRRRVYALSLTLQAAAARKRRRARPPAEA